MSVNPTTRHAGFALANVSAPRRVRPAEFQPAAALALTRTDFRSLSPSSFRAPLGQQAQDHSRFECGVDLLALLKTSPKRLLKEPAVGYVFMNR